MNAPVNAPVDDLPPALQSLLGRRSVSPKRLVGPAPPPAHVALMAAAALRAPDHGRLRPWRVIAIEGSARGRLGEVLAGAFAARHPGAAPEQLARECTKPLRAPLVLAVAAAVTHDNPSVRVVDQQLSAGAAAMNILNAAHLLGYAGMWLTGESCHDPAVKRALGLQADDFIAGWLYLGTAAADAPEPVRPDPSSILLTWKGPA